MKPARTEIKSHLLFIYNLQTFSLRQTNGEHMKSRIIYPPTSPLACKVGKNVSWVYANQ